ncbi:MAG: hypothetical protein CVU11_12985 [Bacteroidetes bacterium HGW-Bacteroidetes-6]|nr:MAG: hypothetical protein CVU11_12985 [Bacteroidetes bacterium HGW-Bacteroidetes-6]
MKLITSILLLAASVQLFAQNYPVKVLDEQEVDFLFNYYEQDGNHSPVTGGIGTEKLDCMAPLTAINVPFDTIRNLSVNVGVDYYTSASSNRIDRFITSASSMFLSSASSADTRVHFDADYSQKSLKNKSDKGVMIGFSHEFDVNSFSAGLHYTFLSENENTELGLRASTFYDVWKLIYPGEIRDGTTYRFGNEEEDYDYDSRFTTTFTATWSQVITRNLQILITTDVVLQKGILNTPFHRVYFDDGLNILNPDTNYMLIAKTMRPETLPRSRFKIPVGLRVNYYLTDWLVARLFYRYYTDDFGIKSNTFSVELPVKVSSWLSVYPLYRYYEQTAAKYFAPFGEHPLDASYQPLEEFYTSDYDLSALINRKYGGGFRISPTYGIHKWKMGSKNNLTFKSFETRYSIYRRSDGLKASSISVNFAFVF